MLPEWTFISALAYLCCCFMGLDANLVRSKRQGLGSFSQARTTNSPFIDTDESSGVNLLLGELNITSAPAVDNTFGAAPTAPPSVLVTTQAPVGTVTKGPAPPATTFAGYLVGSPYPFALPPPDIPYFGSKWNGPWGYPVGHYQAFRGTGQYINHYQYYPLSYFGSLMVPLRYGVSGKK